MTRPSLAFLLTQVGAHANATYAEHLIPLDLSPPLTATLRVVQENGGISQQELATRVQSHPSRIVGIVDTLEDRGLVRRTAARSDRRANEVYVTEKGKECLGRLAAVEKTFQSELFAGLSAQERETLAGLLAKIAEQQGLSPGIHPGFRSRT